jgi:hypothetical protein
METKPCLAMEEETTYALKDKLSAVKELIEDTSQFEHYLSAMRNVLPRATPENFEELFLKELDQLMMEKRDKILKLSENPESLTQEERKSLKFGSDEWMNNVLCISRARTFADTIIFQNDILIGKSFENKLDDPVLDTSVDPEEYDPRQE